MAKKKLLQEVDTSKNVDEVFGELFGQSIKNIINTDDLPEPITIPSGINLLDTVLGGGFQTGTYVSLAAPAASGKSTLALQIVANFKKMFPKGFVLHVDSEQTMASGNRYRMLGLDIDNDNRIKTICYGATVEEVFRMIQSFIALKERLATEYKDKSLRDIPTVVVWDSLDSSAAEAELESENVNSSIGKKPKVLGFWLKKMLRDFRKYNILFITINHISKKLQLEMYPQYDGSASILKDFTINGGKPVIYYPSTLLFLRGREATKADRELFTEKYGLSSTSFKVEATCLKCKSFSYNIGVTLLFEPMTGFNDFGTKLYNLHQDDFLISEGRSFRFSEDSKYKFSISDVKEMYEKDEEFRAEFEECWKRYIDKRFGAYIRLMEQLTQKKSQMELTGVTDSIDMSQLKEIANQASNQNDDMDLSVADFSNEVDSSDEGDL